MLVFLSMMASACEPVPAATLSADLARSEGSYGRNAAEFRAATDAIRVDLSCLAAPIDAPTAARVHRAEGLRAYVDKQLTRAPLAFAAARAIEPAFEFPSEAVPKGNDVLRYYTAANPTAGEMIPLPPPAHGALRLDGVDGAARPAARPAIVQWADASAVLQSAYLWPDQPVFSYPVFVAPTVPVVPVVSEPKADPVVVVEPARPLKPAVSPKKAPTGWWIAGGASLLVGAAAYGVAYATAEDYRNNDHTDAELETLRGRANGLVIVSGGLGAVGIGLGTVGIVKSF